MSRANVYYAQAAAACAFLFHGDDGAHRAKLLDYVARYYTAQPKDFAGLAVAEHFGIEPDELGAKIVAFATQVTSDG
jgi:hypothetical protein